MTAPVAVYPSATVADGGFVPQRVARVGDPSGPGRWESAPGGMFVVVTNQDWVRVQRQAEKVESAVDDAARHQEALRALTALTDPDRGSGFRPQSHVDDDGMLVVFYPTDEAGKVWGRLVCDLGSEFGVLFTRLASQRQTEPSDAAQITVYAALAYGLWRLTKLPDARQRQEPPTMQARRTRYDVHSTEITEGADHG